MINTGGVRTGALTLALALAVGAAGCGGNGGGDKDGAVAADGTSISTAKLSQEELVDACLRASACDIMTYPSLTNCLEAYHKLYIPLGFGPIYNKLYRCVNLAKGDCAAVAACFKWGKACDKDYKATCTGTVAASCDLIGKRVYELDCGDAKLKCAIKSGQTYEASCTSGTCQPGYKDKCEDKREVSCSGGVLEMRDCGVLGMTCGYGGWKKTYKNGCQGESGDKCSGWGKNTFKTSCEGQIAKSCHLSRIHKEDCTKYKMMYTACSGGQCVAAGTACSGSMNRCSGDKLEACLDGNWKAFDCAKLGLGACKKAATYGANCGKAVTP